jgi:AraC-like DNA-binding protein
MIAREDGSGVALDCQDMSASRHCPPQLTRQRLGHLDRVGRHDHEQHQVIYPSSGVLTVTTTAGIWVVPPQRAMWLPAGQPHAHQAWGTTQVCSVLFPPRTDPLGADRPTPLAVSPLLREVLLALTAPAAPPGRRSAHLQRVLLDELLPADTPSLLLPEPYDDRLRAVAAILHDEPGDARTLAEFGRAVGASERTLSRLFHSELGLSFPQWRGQLRLLHAVIGLASGRAVGAVAHEFGYSSPSAFVAAFRRTFGTTPGGYRRAVAPPV